ncbi:Autophagy-related protein 17 [Fulvia fulva]|nr:Autophagy-related protein 17 [Fulvia fulva]WPV14659.1 Autophagy-related protein 17 [Fulvia fulva]WPV29678.1 Autophagy-related protein 17 [Fulvia fulva]
MSTSESSLSSSPPPPDSPEASYEGPPTLERLVIHFVSAKRSLNSTGYVFRANELVTSSRSLIEELAVLNAKNAFAKRGLDEQVDTLDAIRDAIVADGDKVSDQFNATLATLDTAHIRLEKTLKTLRKTVVRTKQTDQAASQGTASESAVSDSQQDEQKTLFDFIDEQNHEDLLSSLRGLIDSHHVARGELNSNLQVFDDSLKSISKQLTISPEASAGPNKPTIYDEPPATIEQLFRGMEDHATEMASSLQNLIQHYDLCVTALKHTEGGGEAAKQAIDIAELAKGILGAEESLYGKTVAEPISDEERAEMLRIIDKDSFEVEDVMAEIRDRASEMESHYQELSRHVSNGRSQNKTLRHVLSLMHEVRAAIPGYLRAEFKYRESWTGINRDILAKTQALADLSVFYEQFLSGYGKLLKEVERRKASEAQMQKVAERAKRDLAKLYGADRVAREEFMEQVGEVLPSDLGEWYGLGLEAPKWSVNVVVPDDELEEE